MKNYTSLRNLLKVISAAAIISGCTHDIVQETKTIPVPDRAAAQGTLELHMVSTGEYDTLPTQLFPPRQYCNFDVPNYAKQVCGTRQVHLWQVGRQAGNKCGYAYYVFVCLQP